VVAILLVAGGAASDLVLTKNSPGGHAKAGTSRTTALPTSTTTNASEVTTTTSAVGAGTLTVVECPTSYGLNGTPASILPDTIATTLDPAVASQLSFYSDATRSIDPILAPKGWVCGAGIGADGGTGISVAPPGTDLSNQQTAPSEEVVADANPACQGCVFDDTCALDPNVVEIYANSYSCKSTVPAGESVKWLNGSPTDVADSPNGTSQIINNVVAFEDPPGVSGDGKPSGGPNPANGVVEFQNGNGEGRDAKETCTLPPGEHALCTAILNDFVVRGWGFAS